MNKKPYCNLSFYIFIEPIYRIFCTVLPTIFSILIITMYTSDHLYPNRVLGNFFTENTGAPEKMEFHPKITPQKFNALEKKA